MRESSNTRYHERKDKQCTHLAAFSTSFLLVRYQLTTRTVPVFHVGGVEVGAIVLPSIVGIANEKPVMLPTEPIILRLVQLVTPHDLAQRSALCVHLADIRDLNISWV